MPQCKHFYFCFALANWLDGDGGTNTNKIKFCLSYQNTMRRSDRSKYKDVNISGYLQPPGLSKLTRIYTFGLPYIFQREKTKNIS